MYTEWESTHLTVPIQSVFASISVCLLLSAQSVWQHCKVYIYTYVRFSRTKREKKMKLHSVLKTSIYVIIVMKSYQFLFSFMRYTSEWAAVKYLQEKRIYREHFTFTFNQRTRNVYGQTNRTDGQTDSSCIRECVCVCKRMHFIIIKRNRNPECGSKILCKAIRFGEQLFGISIPCGFNSLSHILYLHSIQHTTCYI